MLILCHLFASIVNRFVNIDIIAVTAMADISRLSLGFNENSSKIAAVITA